MPSVEDITQLERLDDAAANRWVRKQNAFTRKALDHTATFRRLHNECRLDKNKVLDDIWVTEDGLYQRVLINDEHPKGLLQEIEKTAYCSDNPEWKTLFDIDHYLQTEGKNWEFNDIFYEKFNKKAYVLIGFSDAGSDAFMVRELNVKKNKIVAGGFSLPKGRHDILWHSRDSLLLATDYGLHTLTQSNYPRSIRLLKRGQALSEAATVFNIDPTHMEANTMQFGRGNNRFLFFVDKIDFYRSVFNLVSNKDIMIYHPLPIPQDAELFDIYRNTALIKLNSNWQLNDGVLLKENSLIGFDLEEFRKNPSSVVTSQSIRVWYEGSQHVKIENVLCDDTNVYLVIYHFSMEIIRLIPSLKSIRACSITRSTEYNNISLLSIDCDGEMLFYFETFLQPKTLYGYNPKSAVLRIIKQDVARFDAAQYFVRLLTTISKDGTIVPYHIVAKKNLKQDGLNPTILYGYGGFDDCLNPAYLSLKSIALLEKNFVYVHAHIRGGGELGPQWHKMGMQGYKQNSFDDFIAVAENLIALKITSPRYLGIEGASNGGLLVAACATQRPDLFSSVFCDVAVLDMRRYHQLMVGLSWFAEYGNPANCYSPLHHIDPEKTYPKLFIQSSKTDDRVHPYHARAMTYQLQASKKQVLYFEKKDGGHTGVTFEECIRVYTYWHLQLLLPAQQARKRGREDGQSQVCFFQEPLQNNTSVGRRLKTRI